MDAVTSSHAHGAGDGIFRFAIAAVRATVILAGLAAISQAETSWSWRNPLPTGASLSAVALIDADTATVVGSGGTIMRTSDGGATWTPQSSGATGYLNAVCFTDSNTGTAV